MASILITDIDESLHRRLAAHAAAHRRSVEDEAREMLRAAVTHAEAPAPESLTALSHRLFGSAHGTELHIPARGSTTAKAPPEFGGSEDAASDPP